MLLKIILLYLIVINVVGLFLMGMDKRRAKRDQWRVPEKRFFLIALIGGSLGCWLGMQCFHHKTMHKSFTIGMPIILIIQILLLISLYGKGLLVSF